MESLGLNNWYELNNCMLNNLEIKQENEIYGEILSAIFEILSQPEHFLFVFIKGIDVMVDIRT